MRRVIGISTVILLTTSLFVSAQKPTWKSIMMLDTTSAYGFAVDQVENYKYGPSHLFDENLKTCWVTGKNSIYMLVPQYNRVLNIFNGYGKSQALYQQNDRVKKLKINYYLGVQPDGHVAEMGAEYYLYDPHITQNVILADSMGIQHIALLDSMFEDQLILTAAFNNFANEVGYEINEVMPVIQIEIIDTYHGTRYRDICISELFFGDKYIFYTHESQKSTFDTLYINEDENALIAGLSNGNEQVLYTNRDEVVWLSEVSKTKEWVLIMTMPVASGGRGLTDFKLINTTAIRVVNNDLQKSLGKSIAEMYFEYKDSILYLQCIETPVPEDHLVKLGNY